MIEPHTENKLRQSATPLRSGHALGLAPKLILAALLLGWCVLLVDCDFIAPRHGWAAQFGPRVPHESFPGDCGICHVPERWDILREDFTYDHGAETGYPLEGAHAQAVCLRCHNDRGPVQIYVARGCGGCHVDPHKGSLGMDCERCHNEVVWEPIGLIADHARTRFPLLALHAITPCESCHDRATVGDFRGAPVECHFCHQRDAARAFPNHILNGWVRNCERCHTPANWTPEGFTHGQFPLVGGHAGLDCTQCHVNGLFRNLDPDCVACHLNDYIAAPNHVANGFSTNCIDCHDINAWR